MLEAERAAIAAAARSLASERLVFGTAGNVSARAGELVAITPTGAELAALETEQVAVIDLDGVQRDGELAPTSELALHLGVYRRYGAGAVVHTHSSFATALSTVIDELPVIHYGQMALGGPVRVAPYATFGTPELAEATLAALADRYAALMANHGTVAHAPTLAQALEHTRLLEWCAELYWRAAALGTPRALDAGQRAEHTAAVQARGYGTTQAREVAG